MGYRLLTFFVCLTASFIGHAQIFPSPGAKLNYSQVMFEYPKVKGAAIYQVQVAQDTTGASFENYLIEQKDSATATLINNLQFGKKYQWRYTGIKNGHEMEWKGPYYFQIVTDTLIKKNLLRLTVSVNDTNANAGGLIINDGTHTVVDRNGKMIWYLPNIDWKFNLVRSSIRAKNNIVVKRDIEIKPYIFDLRLTPYGTVTYLTDSALFDRDLNGTTLWKKHDCKPVSNMGEEYYNHIFTRLSNGHYLVLGGEVWRKLPDYCDAEIHTKYPVRRTFDGQEYAKVEFGTVLEYDKNGNVVWNWNSEAYLDSSPLNPVIGNRRLDYELKAHVNSLNTDPDNEFVYVGFRDINRIIKIKKETGKVVDSWGAPSVLGTKPMHKVPFYRQHDISLLKDGNIAVFDNNDYPGRDSIPSVIVFSQQPENSGKVLWKYDYQLDSADRRKSRTGGNVEELKNGNFLVCTGANNTIFEVTKDKKIVWQACITPNLKPDFNYRYRLYRAHYISSLYPCYFTFQPDEDTVKKRSPRFNIRIFNKGSEKDAYDVKITSASGNVVQHFTTDPIGTNRSVTYKIKPDKQLIAGRKIEISISSKTNPDFERKNWVVVR